jgi:hypothetical protein
MVESAPFEILRKAGDFEVRRYPDMILASVYGMSDDEAFRLLFGFIAGSNSGKKQIPMTAPVINASKGEKIAMTTPVVSDESSFSFVMPAGSTLENVPQPSDERVVIELRPGRTVAVLSFHGRHDISDVGPKIEELMQLVKKEGLRPRGSAFLMRYNSPFTPGFIRHNEVAVALEE